MPRWSVGKRATVHVGAGRWNGVNRNARWLQPDRLGWPAVVLKPQGIEISGVLFLSVGAFRPPAPSVPQLVSSDRLYPRELTVPLFSVQLLASDGPLANRVPLSVAVPLML
jgi:hypothetical protein